MYQRFMHRCTIVSKRKDTVRVLRRMSHILGVIQMYVWVSYKRVNCNIDYRKTSSISRTESQNSNVSNLVLQLSLFNPLKPGVKSRMKM